ncbi:MAG TPA: HIT family protein [Bacillota bacterium]|nr:HIT family protein [Bacillota bacterium]
MSHEDCIFCKIIDGKLPAAKVYEDAHVYAFLDISQVTKGHTLVIPKEHTKDVYNTPADVAGNLFSVVPTIANGIKKAFQPAGLNVLINNEKAAGQEVFHTHIHLIPRYGKQDDGFKAKWETHNDDYTMEALEDIAWKIAGSMTCTR